MPPLIAAVLVGVGAYAGLKAFQKVLSNWSEIETSASQQAATTTTAAEKDLGTLEFDPATGVYRPGKPAP